MITILCSGSRGDFQPYIALAQELQKLGKSVRITASTGFEKYINNYGIDIYPVSMDYQSADIDPKLIQEAQSSDNLFKMLLTFNKMKKYAVKLTEEMFSACKGSELIIYHPGCSIGYFAGKKLGIPSMLAAPFPMHRTKEVSSLISYGKTRMPKSLSYDLLQGMLWMAGKTGIVAFFKKEFGNVPRPLTKPFEKINQNHLALISCSNYVFPRPKDWNSNIHQYGYWFVEEKTSFIPSDELADFLAQGEKPVYVGFGSVFDGRHKDETVKIIIEALDKTGKRGIISGMGNIDDLPKHLIAINNVPHSWLFEHVSMVVHHGGAGTTAAGFAAGIPSIVIPFSNDQFAWAHRAFDLGVGSKPIYRKKLTTDKLAAAIQFVQDEKIILDAKRLSEKITTENGAGYCAKIIVDFLNN